MSCATTPARASVISLRLSGPTSGPAAGIQRAVLHPRRRLTRVAVAQQARPKTDAEETTEKYGLEAGLWKVLTSKDDPSCSADDAGASVPSTSGAAEAKSLSKTEQAKALLARYGSAYLITSISFAIVSFAACYAAVSAGVDVGALLSRVGLQVNDTSEKVGAFALAYAAHKALSPVRFPPTVALTPVVARWLGKDKGAAKQQQ